MFADNPDKDSQAPSNVFALATPQHLLIKLAWEIGQLRRSFEVEQPIAWTHAPAYHAFNCAVTCWHLSDWTWEAIDSQTKQVVAERLGARLRTLEDFQGALRTRHRALHICWQIANGSKHFRLRKTDVDIQTQNVWEYQPAMAGSMQAGEPLGSYRYRLVLTDKGQPIEALALFEESEGIWARELASWFLIEPQGYVEGVPLRRL
ncbi:MULTISPECIES: hypothetical protein [unclassified Bradyrhizobium]|uniref:hypothetical protein n=1 Tax=unclassified Bradyrhizobium TaxID=2631580 RepID=UPI0029161266|nr:MULTISPECIES: hypothetical protein [unclassified Bradyrhizobium]